MKLLGDDVCISRIHGGGKGNVVWLRCQPTTVSWFTTGTWGNTFRSVTISIAASSKIEPSLIDHDGKPLMLRRKLAGRNFHSGGF
jgi:hypothetical protein